jgi:DNA-binding transcriptional ArsR family regulator
VIERSADLLAEGLWLRLRDILMVQSRWDAFVHDPEGRDGGAALPPSSIGRTASDMVLRALRVGADPVNIAILRRLVREEEIAIADLMEQIDLSQIALVEALNDLSQVGLASYAMESRTARATDGAVGLLGLLEEVRGRLARIVEERWSAAG